MNTYSNVINKGAFYLLLLFSLVFTSCTFHDVEVLGVENFKVEKISTDGLSIGVDVKINNPNKFAIKVKKIELEVYVKNDLLATTHLDKSIKLKPNSTQTYHFTISDKNGSLNKKIIPKLLLNGLAGGNFPIKYKGYVKGSFFLFSKKIPIEGKEEFSF
jgi:LEA14-like dessication related protein